MSERGSWNLTARTSKDMGGVMARTGDSKTDVINRALEVYADIVKAIDNGGGLYVMHKPGEVIEKIRLV